MSHADWAYLVTHPKCLSEDSGEFRLVAVMVSQLVTVYDRTVTPAVPFFFCLGSLLQSFSSFLCLDYNSPKMQDRFVQPPPSGFPLNHTPATIISPHRGHALY